MVTESSGAAVVGMVTCELAGFKKFLTTEVWMTAQQTTTLLIPLTVGARSDSIEVTAAATQVDTVSATMQNGAAPHIYVVSAERLGGPWTGMANPILSPNTESAAQDGKHCDTATAYWSKTGAGC